MPFSSICIDGLLPQLKCPAPRMGWYRGEAPFGGQTMVSFASGSSDSDARITLVG